MKILSGYLIEVARESNLRGGYTHLGGDPEIDIRVPQTEVRLRIALIEGSNIDFAGVDQVEVWAVNRRNPFDRKHLMAVIWDNFKTKDDLEYLAVELDARLEKV